MAIVGPGGNNIMIHHMPNIMPPSPPIMPSPPPTPPTTPTRIISEAAVGQGFQNPSPFAQRMDEALISSTNQVVQNFGSIPSALQTAGIHTNQSINFGMFDNYVADRGGKRMTVVAAGGSAGNRTLS